MRNRKSNDLREFMKVLCVLFMILFFVLAPVGYANQAEHLTTNASMNAQVGRHGSLDEHSRLVQNDVNIAWRHCQAYENAQGVVDELGAAMCAGDARTLFKSETRHNLRTNAGGDWQASVMANTSAPPATCNYIALSNDSTAPAPSDTSVASEIAANGLSRAQGTYAHTTGTSSFTVQKVFSATGTQASQKAGLLNASSSGTLCFENTYTQVTVNNGDTLTVTWTVNY